MFLLWLWWPRQGQHQFKLIGNILVILLWSTCKYDCQHNWLASHMFAKNDFRRQQNKGKMFCFCFVFVFLVLFWESFMCQYLLNVWDFFTLFWYKFKGHTGSLMKLRNLEDKICFPHFRCKAYGIKYRSSGVLSIWTYGKTCFLISSFVIDGPYTTTRVIILW